MRNSHLFQFLLQFPTFFLLLPHVGLIHLPASLAATDFFSVHNLSQLVHSLKNSSDTKL